jgi:hypothetical protein
MRHLALLALAATLTACAGTTPPPATEIRTQTVVRETMRPCEAAHPARPAKLPDALPTDLYALSVTLALKLDEYTAPGKWADQMDSSLTSCTKP